MDDYEIWPGMKFSTLVRFSYQLARAEDQSKAEAGVCGAQWCHEQIDAWGECGLCTTHAFQLWANE